jgi:hypothetical protein
MTFEDFERAYWSLANAGRELGSGPAVAVQRIVPDVDEVLEWLVLHVPSYERQGAMLLGIAIGLIMAEEPETIGALEQISQEWRERH